MIKRIVNVFLQINGQPARHFTNTSTKIICDEPLDHCTQQFHECEALHSIRNTMKKTYMPIHCV